MSRSRVLTFAVSVVFVMTLVSSVRADSVHSPRALQTLNFGQLHTLELSSVSRMEVREFLAQHFDIEDFGGFLEQFEGNNGLHLGFFKNEKHLGESGDSTSVGASTNNGRHVGFSVAFFNPGMRFGLVNGGSLSPASASPNPEPTAMLLFGTGLAGVAAFARRLRRRKNTN